MNIPFENLEKINEVLEKLNTLEQKINSEKRWLNTKEASYYLGYSKEHIHKLKDNYLIEGKHYYKKAGRVLFDKLELDTWVTTSLANKDTKAITEKLLEGIL